MSTLMEESISKSADATFGESLAPEEFRRLIRRIGRIPAERSTTYQILRQFPTAHEETPAAPSLRIALEEHHHAHAGSSC